MDKSTHTIRFGNLRLPRDQKLVEKIVFELNEYHRMKNQTTPWYILGGPSEIGFAMEIIEAVLNHYTPEQNIPEGL